MNLRFLRTLVAVSEYQSFSVAGEAVGLSHSAVSLQIKSLEHDLDIQIVDRTHRPAILTAQGWALVDQAARILELVDGLDKIREGKALVGSLSVGVVHTAMASFVPAALAALRDRHPDFQLSIQTGLSGELATGVHSGDLDVAITTAPVKPIRDLESRLLRREPLYIIYPESVPCKDEEDLLSNHPYIWFNRKTWAGRQIEQQLLERGVLVNEMMEVNSIEAIVDLVKHDLGISIVPWISKSDQPTGVHMLPFGKPQLFRALVFMERKRNTKRFLSDTLYGCLLESARVNH